MPKIEVIKITAIGTSRCSMRVRLENGYEKSCFIPKELYEELKKLGAPTSQQISWNRRKQQN